MRASRTTVSLALILLLLSQTFGYLTPSIAPAVAQGTESPWNLVRLTRNNYDDIFDDALTELVSGPLVGTFPSYWKPKAYGATTVWHRLGDESQISYSFLGPSTGSVRAANVTDLVMGKRGGFFDEGLLLLAGGPTLRRGTQHWDNITILDPRSGNLRTVSMDIPWAKAYPTRASSWGDFFVAVARVFRADHYWSQGQLASQYGSDTEEIAVRKGDSWYQYTPNDHSVLSVPCPVGDTTRTNLVLIDPTRPLSIPIPGGSGKFAWIRIHDEYHPSCNSAGGLGFFPINSTQIDIMLEDGTVVRSFPPARTINSGCVPFSGPAGQCLAGILVYYDNVLLYQVRNYDVPYEGAPRGEVWMYDRRTGANTFLETFSRFNKWRLGDGLNGGMWSDGNSVIWYGKETSEEDAEVYLYNNAFGIRRLTDNRLDESYDEQRYWIPRVRGNWAFWENRTASGTDFIVYDISRDKFTRLDSKNTNAFLAGVDLNDGLLVWKGAYEALHIYNAELGLETKIDTKQLGISNLARAITSQGWIFLSGRPIGENDYEIFALQPLTIHASVTVAGKNLPLREVRVDVDLGGGKVITAYTDKDGYAGVPLNTPWTKLATTPTFSINLTQRDGKFRIVDYSRAANPPDNAVVFSTNELAVLVSPPRTVEVNDLLVPLNAAVLAGRASTKTSASTISRIEDMAYIYYRTHQAYQLARDVLLADTMLNRTIDIRAFSRVDGVFFDVTAAGSPYINIEQRSSDVWHLDAPNNREWHEFGHAVMWFSPIGGPHAFPDDKSPFPIDSNNDGKITCTDFRFRLVGTGYYVELSPNATTNQRSSYWNHCGYQNVSSIDSYVEGFAEFYSLLVKQLVEKHPTPWLYSYLGGTPSLEQNHRVHGQAEEFAAAGILWDLVDRADPTDSDGVQLDVFRVWRTLVNENVSNVYQLWRAFKINPGVNQTFVAHAVYEDLDGNLIHDVGEPLGTSRWARLLKVQDANGDTIPDTIVGVPWITSDVALFLRWNPAPTNAAWWVETLSRKGRTNPPPPEGSAIQLNFTDSASGSEVNDVIVTVCLNFEQKSLNYCYEVPLKNSKEKLYLFLPEGFNSTATLTLRSQGYESRETVTITSNFYFQKVYDNIWKGKDVLLTFNGTLARQWGSIRDYSLPVTRQGIVEIIKLQTNTTLGGWSYAPESSVLVLTTSGPNASTAWMKVALPRSLVGGNPLAVDVDRALLVFKEEGNSTHRVLSFTYGQSIREIRVGPTSVVPEFPNSTMFSVLLIALLFVALLKANQKPRGSLNQPRVNLKIEPKTRSVICVGGCHIFSAYLPPGYQPHREAR